MDLSIDTISKIFSEKLRSLPLERGDKNEGK